MKLINFKTKSWRYPLWHYLPLLLLLFIFNPTDTFAANPCDALVVNFDTNPQGYSGTAGSSSNTVPCGNSANTIPGTPINGTGMTSHPITQCGAANMNDVLWVTFLVQPGGSFEWQAVAGADEFYWEMWWSTDGTCNNLVYGECGGNFTGWGNFISTPNPNQSVQAYVAVYFKDGYDTGDFNLKLRKGCGEGSPCTLSLDHPETTTCNNDGTYTVTANVSGSNGTFTATDLNANSISTNPNPLTFTSGAGGVFNGTITAVYPQGTNYNISVASPSNDCHASVHISGTAPHCCTPTVHCPSPPGMFACGDDAGIHAWLNSVTYNDCGNGYTITNDYDPHDFDKCAQTTKNIRFSLVDIHGTVWADCVVALTIDAAPLPTIHCPANLTVDCTHAGTYSPPHASYSNGLMGACGLSGSVSGTVTASHYDECGGTLTVTYSGHDDCGRTLTPVHCTVTVNAAPKPTIHCPANLTVDCAHAGTYSPPHASYSNGLMGACGLSGTVSGTVTASHYDGCGGTLTVKYQGMDNCHRPLDPVYCTVTVNAAPKPTIHCPANLTVDCTHAGTYSPPHANYSNGLMGACGLSGSVSGTVTASHYDECGGTLTVKYSGQDDCGRTLDDVYCTVMVNAAPLPTIHCPAHVTIDCDDADGYHPPHASYSNGLMGACGLSGSVSGSVTASHYDACNGGSLTVTYTGHDDCGRMLTPVHCTVTVRKADAPTIHRPAGVPHTLTCTMAAHYTAPPATYSNGSSGDCKIEGTLHPMVEENWCPCQGGYIKVTYQGTDICGNPLYEQYMITVTGGCCDLPFCTYTQGYYGNAGGTQNGLNTTQILNALLAGNPLSVGDGSNCGFTASTASCILGILPAGGKSESLDPNYNLNCNKKIKNTLVGQLVTLKLNIRYNQLLNPNGPLDLSCYPLSAACLYVPGSVSMHLPANPTVGDLITLADDFLACQCSGSCGSYPSNFGDLTGVLGYLNERWDECASPAACSPVAPFAVPNMLRFDAEKMEMETKVEWSMLQDENVSHFEVEVSTDGLTFDYLGTVPSLGSNNARTYSLMDYAPDYGDNYYRLKIFEDNGDYYYSHQRFVNFDINFADIHVYPNPTSNQVFVMMKDFAGKEGLVEVFNSYGQKMAERRYQAFPSGAIQFDVNDYSNGMHYISIKVDGHRRFTKKFIVSKL